jgi:hypothetical protein
MPKIPQPGSLESKNKKKHSTNHITKLIWHSISSLMTRQGNLTSMSSNAGKLRTYNGRDRNGLRSLGDRRKPNTKKNDQPAYSRTLPNPHHAK